MYSMPSLPCLPAYSKVEAEVEAERGKYPQACSFTRLTVLITIGPNSLKMAGLVYFRCTTPRVKIKILRTVNAVRRRLFRSP